MHNSGITSGARIECMHGTNESSTVRIDGATAYDMFYNDSFSTGLDENEL